jgi:hypothetical protein
MVLVCVLPSVGLSQEHMDCRQYSLQISTERTVYRQDEDVVVHIQITNATTENLPFINIVSRDAWILVNDSSLRPVITRLPEGELVTSLPPHRRREDKSLNEDRVVKMTLKPSDTYEQKVNISALFDLEKGECSLQFQYIGGRDACEKALLSNSVRIRIE